MSAQDSVPVTTNEATPDSLAREAEEVLRKGSGGRLLMKVAIGVVAVGALGALGFFGWKALRVQSAKGTPMVAFSATKLTVGSDLFVEDGPAHEVSLDAFRIDATEVTVKAYRVCMDDGACTPTAKGAHCNLEIEE